MENSILIYLVKASVALALFFGLYLLLFRRDTFLVTKRICLLASLLFSALIPFITLHFSADENPRIPTSWLSEVVVVPFSNENQETMQALDWQSTLVATLFLVSSLFLIRFGLQLFEVFHLKYRNLSQKATGYTLVQISEKKVSPFSFFKWIFAGANAWELDTENEILRHEMVHVKQWHSIDVMLSELFCIAFWWNPVVWFYRREIRINHEYLADRGVLRVGYNPQQYQYLLLQTLTITNRIPINNHFNVSQLKQRIAMMNKKQSPWLSATKYLLFLPLSVLLIAGNAVKASQIKILNEIAENTAIGKSIQNTQDHDEKIQANNDLEQAEADRKASNNQEKNIALGDQQKEAKKAKAFTGVEQMPQFPGGAQAMMDYLSKSIRYPEVAAKNGIQGRVTVRFIVDETGAVTDIAVIKGLDPSCDQEAIRVVKAMPKWIPGKQKGQAVPVYYTMPISYRLE
ncbi:MAG: Outer rane transport energization protein TonB [Bacteroidetes bacterium]|nr:Outer rane transport energization protein TonB [Bacteroidota bacterium]